MVVEHTFITTLEAQPALERAGALLSSRGFAHAGTRYGSDAQLHMNRGNAKAAKARSVTELPQVVRIEWDRGRVMVAASIEASPTWGGASSWGGISERPQKMTLHTRLLTAIANALEAVVARDLPVNEAAAEWDHVERDVAEAAAEHARRSRRRMIILWSILAIIIGAIVAVTILSN